ncbi:MAG: sulfotransferase [Hydrogenophilales bacterium]|nr:sulfotransferase [Hydrogenophilales bacterium]
MAQSNILTRSKKSKAAELFKANRLQEADALYAGMCQVNGADADSWVMRGIINRKLGRFNEAEMYCRRAMVLAPRLAVAHHALGAAVQCLGRVEEALACYRRALQLQPDFAEAHYFLANALKETHALDEAVASYRSAIALKSDFVAALGNLGILLTLMENIPEAVEVLNRAIVLKPDAPQLHSALGRVLLRDGKIEQAIARYQMSMQLHPCADTASELVEPLERSGRPDEAQALLDEYFPQAPDYYGFLLVAARLARREGKFTEALSLYEKAARQNQDAQAQIEILIASGQIYDRLGEAERAFELLTQGNALAAKKNENVAEIANYSETLANVGRYLVPGQGHINVSSIADDEGQAPVFVFGFPRSGTTLLEQILDSHPALQAMEEKPAVKAMFEAFEKLTQGRVDALASLNPDEITRLRAAYFAEVACHVKLKPGGILVDRMPLNTIYAPLIRQVFPSAKLVLAIRHPCDVCLSCFMQAFAANTATVNFHTLESTVEIYAKVMLLWQQYDQVLRLDHHRIRYEDLVSDFEAETRALLEYIGVGWHENVRNHTEHAIKRGRIGTASYQQVVQPLYQHAKYRWERYADKFAPLMPVLQPFVEYFNYGAQCVANSKAHAL